MKTKMKTVPPRKKATVQSKGSPERTSARKTGDVPEISLSSADIERILGKWIIERHDVKSREWQGVEAKERKKMLGKLVKFKLRGMFPWLPKFGKYRDKDFIIQQYSKTWAVQPWPSLNEPLTPKMRTAATWRNEGLVFRRAGLTRLSLELLARCIERQRPCTVLEVGSGSGRNLISLSTRFPDVSFTGIELTQAGVDRANSVTKLKKLPQDVKDYAPWPKHDEKAYRRVKFLQGSATEMPFADSSFDLVFSHAALEQMENVREAALKEYRRVAKSAIVMVEPFGDFNEDGFRPLSIKAKNYLTLRTEQLPALGIMPKLRWSDWPRKITAGYGLVIAEKSEMPKS